MIPALLGPLVSGAASALLGGLARRASQRDADRRAAAAREAAIADRDESRAYWLERDADRFERLRESATEAGFHPLTALQYGGATMPGGDLELPSGVGDAIPRDYTSHWAPALQSLSDELTGQGAIRREQQRLQTETLRLEAERLEAGGVGPIFASSLGGGGALPGWAPYRGPNDDARGVDYDPMRTGVQIFGGYVVPDLGMSDAEISEQRYGDFVSWLYGIGVAAADLYSTFWTNNPDRLPQTEAGRGQVSALTRAVGNLWSGQGMFGPAEGPGAIAVPIIDTPFAEDQPGQGVWMDTGEFRPSGSGMTEGPFLRGSTALAF